MIYDLLGPLRPSALLLTEAAEAKFDGRSGQGVRNLPPPGDGWNVRVLVRGLIQALGSARPLADRSSAASPRKGKGKGQAELVGKYITTVAINIIHRRC